MKDTVSISLLETANIEKMIEFFKSSKLTKKMIISTNSEEHKYATKYPNGLYISFGYLTLSQDFFLFSFVKMVANLFGSERVNPKNKIMCKYYKYNAENFLLVDLKGIQTPTEKIIIYENKIISKIEAESLYENINEHYQGIELIKLIDKDIKDPRDSETGIFSKFILKYFTEQKELISIYQSVSQLKHYK
jgi:hypothetical protein